MKLLKYLGLILFVFALSLASVHAFNLTVIDEDVVKDEVSGLYWYRNIDEFVFMNYSEQINAISNLAGDWRMANEGEMNSLWGYDTDPNNPNNPNNPDYVEQLFTPWDESGVETFYFSPTYEDTVAGGGAWDPDYGDVNDPLWDYTYFTGRWEMSTQTGYHNVARGYKRDLYDQASDPDVYVNTGYGGTIFNTTTDIGGYGDIGAWVVTDSYGDSEQPPAVPEPSTYMLLSFGIVMLAGFRKKFQK